MSRRGFTIVETLIATFILVSAMFGFIALFHTSLQHQSRVERLLVARDVAQSALDEIRAWARDMDNFRNQWAQHTSAPYTLPGSEAYPIRVEVAAGPILAKSPCSSFSDDYGPRGKTIRNALLPIRVSVEAYPGREVVLDSYIAEPPRRLRAANPVELTWEGGDPGTLSFRDRATVQARAYDQDGLEIEDMTFSWTLVPDTTAGDPGVGTLHFDTLNKRRDQAEVEHVVYLPGPIWPGDPVSRGGACKVRARAVTFGGSGEGELDVSLAP